MGSRYFSLCLFCLFLLCTGTLTAISAAGWEFLLPATCAPLPPPPPPPACCHHLPLSLHCLQVSPGPGTPLHSLFFFFFFCTLTLCLLVTTCLPAYLFSQSFHFWRPLCLPAGALICSDTTPAHATHWVTFCTSACLTLPLGGFLPFSPLCTISLDTPAYTFSHVFSIPCCSRFCLRSLHPLLLYSLLNLPYGWMLPL